MAKTVKIEIKAKEKELIWEALASYAMACKEMSEANKIHPEGDEREIVFWTKEAKKVMKLAEKFKAAP